MAIKPTGQNWSTHISVVNEDKVNTHSSNVRGTHVGSVHKRNAIHGTNCHHQSSVDSANNLLLLIGAESMIVIDLRADLAGSIIKVLEVGLSLNVGGIHALLLLHDETLLVLG